MADMRDGNYTGTMDADKHILWHKFHGIHQG
jgi:uncharacterized protein with FMN-binding domain